ncbi:MAG: hypothetical protein SWH78_15770 [Thermodesulfobacteriota bacterium]|nr:hypothetical protein [Thermodesulfobacteriota bacterium]
MLKMRLMAHCGNPYGVPSMDARLERDLHAGKIVLGGCVVADHAPIWQCVDCGAQNYKNEGLLKSTQTLLCIVNAET